MKQVLQNRKLLLSAAGAAVLLLLLIIGIFYIHHLDRAFDSGKTDTVHVRVEPGMSTGEIGSLLEEKGVIESGSKFKLYSKVKRYGNRYQAGTYGFSSAMKLSEIAEMLISGKTSSQTFTVPEGYTLGQIKDRLAEDGIVDREKFDELLKSGNFDYDFLAGAQTGENHLEGYLFPETYSIDFGADEETIIRTMLEQFDAVFTAKMKARAEKMGYSLNEIMVIASIIERESKVPEERGKVASVIYNRLQKGMPLQMCSTVQYILGEQKEVLTYADTEIESPYNTYLHQGLPPGPICCPGKDAIKAALYPEKTDYLYFVVSDKLDGTQNFSKDIRQFEKDKAAYYKALEEKTE